MAPKLLEIDQTTYVLNFLHQMYVLTIWVSTFKVQKIFCREASNLGTPSRRLLFYCML